MKRLLHTPLALLLRRIVLLYAVLMLCRVVFYLYNAQLLGTIGRGELWQLLAGSLKFDTVSVIYANGVFILLALLPLHVRERSWYRKLMYWYYVAVNAVLVVAVNMSDCVYFRYTQKRFTADEVFFADNSNSVQLVGKFMAENWYLVLVAAALVALLAWGYGRKVREESLLSRGWAYYVGSTVTFATGAGLSIAGMRGGMTRMTRRITLSQRHPLYRRQRQGEPHPEQPVLHPADDRQRGKHQLQKIFHPRRTAAAFHARAPARRQCGGEPGRAQRHGLHHGEHVGPSIRPI